MNNIPENIIFLKGDVLKTTADIICHQVNCKSIMGAGLAKQIKTIYPKVYRQYADLCNQYNCSSQLLGTVDFCETDNYIIANCFGQWGISRTVRQTDYDALKKCFKTVKNYTEENNLKCIAMPYNIGCGLAGGDWNTVLNIIIDVFKNTNLTIKIVEWDKS